ncbi:MAG: hypothetical protein AAF645_07155 [Myxococcota bacterium]
MKRRELGPAPVVRVDGKRSRKKGRGFARGVKTNALSNSGVITGRLKRRRALPTLRRAVPEEVRGVIHADERVTAYIDPPGSTDGLQSLFNPLVFNQLKDCKAEVGVTTERRLHGKRHLAQSVVDSHRPDDLAHRLTVKRPVGSRSSEHGNAGSGGGARSTRRLFDARHRRRKP